jgi:anion-transporting  ArsA/GET3 family ATPase
MSARISQPHPLPREPHVIVCAGGGGVGKTTTSAALALALARRGLRTLVVTIDPARRLADALGVTIGPLPHVVHVDAATGDRLWALMPEPQASTRTFMEFLFRDEPASLERLFSNRLFLALSDALAGMHELVCMTLVARAASEHTFDYVIVDTAPSRYALDFVSYPPRLAALLESRAMGFFGSLAAKSGTDSEGAAAGLARKTAEAALARGLGGRLVLDLTSLFSEMLRVRERFAGLANQSARLLLGESARYVLVAAPTGSALADVRFLARKLEKLSRAPSAVVLNRADVAQRAWAAPLLADAHTPPALAAALRQIEAEREARTSAADQMSEVLARHLASVPRVRLPFVESRSPAEIVLRLADEIASGLSVLAGL